MKIQLVKALTGLPSNSSKGYMVATLYINNELVLTAWMYAANAKEWGFLVNSNVTMQDIKVYK